MKKLIIILLALLMLSSLVIAGPSKIPIYNPFGRHLQWLTTGFDGALTKDIIWDVLYESTKLNTSINSSDSVLYITDNLTTKNFPVSGVLIIGTEAIVYDNYTISTNLSADNTTLVGISKRGAYSTIAASHTATDSVYYVRYSIGENNSLPPLFAIDNSGYVGFGTMSPQDQLVVSYSTEANSQIAIGPPLGIAGVNLAVPGIEIGATSGNAGIIMGINATNYGQIDWYGDAVLDYFRITTSGSGRALALQTNGGNVSIGNVIPNASLHVSGDIIARKLDTGQGLNELYDMNQNVLTTSNVTFLNITADDIDANLTWTNLYGYPAACPSGSAVTTLDDSVTCTDSWVNTAGDSMTGNLNMTNNNITNVSNLWVSNLHGGSDINLEDNLDGTGYNITVDKIEVINDLTVNKNLTGNLITGEVWYHNHTATALNFEVDGVYYNMTWTNWTLNGFRNNGDHELIADVAGLYLVNWFAIGDGQNNHKYVGTIQVNNVPQSNMEDHKKMTAGGDITSLHGTGFARLTSGDVLTLSVADDGGTGAGNYYGSNLNLVRIGD